MNREEFRKKHQAKVQEIKPKGQQVLGVLVEENPEEKKPENKEEKGAK